MTYAVTSAEHATNEYNFNHSTSFLFLSNAFHKSFWPSWLLPAWKWWIHFWGGNAHRKRQEATLQSQSHKTL